MKNNNNYSMDYNNRRNNRATEYTKSSTRKKAKNQNIVIASITIALVAAIAATFMIMAAANTKPTAGTEPTTVAKMLNGSNASLNAEKTTVNSNSANANNTDSTATSKQSTDRIDNINGERVYIDTKRTAPDKTGTPLHFYANGKTSYGFDWNYDADNSNFVLRCDYNFNQQQYDFQFYGVTPGTSHVTLYYNTDDTTKVPVNLTIIVDDALNVTMG